MKSRPRIFISLPAALALGAALFLVGCGGERKPASETQEQAGAVSDTAAYRAAAAEPDTVARIGALTGFLQDYPQSPFRASAYSRLYDAVAAQDPAQAGQSTRDYLKTERDPDARARLYYNLYRYNLEHAPDAVVPTIQAILKDDNVGEGVYNMVAWNLVEHEEHLDEAVRLAAVGAEKAADSLSKAMVLDTEGWAYYVKGDYQRAVETLKQAVAYQSDEELLSHLAEASDKAGLKKEARDLYKELLYTQEDPTYRARLTQLTRDLGGSVSEVDAEIEQHRLDNSKPMTDIALKDYQGKELRLSDFKGQVILLNFWHPT